MTFPLLAAGFGSAFWLGWVDGMLALSVPLLYAAYGEIFVARTGLFNLGIEGQMLLAAFAAFVVGAETGSAPLMLLSAAVCGAAVGFAIAFFVLNLRGSLVLVPIAIVILALGLTSSLFRTIYGGSAVDRESVKLPEIGIPLLSDIPVAGVLFEQTLLVYGAIAAAPVVWFVLFRTSLGLSLRAVGGNPEAALAAGIDQKRMQSIALIFGGTLAGIGGAALLLESGFFFDGMTAGRGFIALALAEAARWSPGTVLIGGLLFGGADALQVRLQVVGVDVPFEFLLMVPYALTVLAVFIFARRFRELASAAGG